MQEEGSVGMPNLVRERELNSESSRLEGWTPCRAGEFPAVFVSLLLVKRTQNREKVAGWVAGSPSRVRSIGRGSRCSTTSEIASLRLLSLPFKSRARAETDEYVNYGETKMWGIPGIQCNSLDGCMIPAQPGRLLLSERDSHNHLQK